MSTTTEAVIDHHLEAFGNGDIDDLMVDYLDNSILITPERTLNNLNEIYALLINLSLMLSCPGVILSFQKNYKR